MNRTFRSGVLGLAILAVLAAVPSSASAVSGVWWASTNPNGGREAASGNWDLNTNWFGSVMADGSGSTADFSLLNLPTAGVTITLVGTRTIGNLIIGDTDAVNSAGNWTLTGSTLTLAGTTPTITVKALGAANVATISAALDGSSGLTKTGPGPLTLTANSTTLTGAIKITSGNLLSGGTINLSGAAGALTGISALTVGGNGTFNLGDAATGVANRINTAASLTLGDTTGGGTFNVLRGAATANNQSFVSLTVGPGMNTIANGTTTGGTITPTLTFSGANSYIRNAGGIVNFNGGANLAIAFTTAPTSAMIGGILPGAILNSNDLVDITSGSPAATTSYVSDTYTTPGANVKVTTTGGAMTDGTINSLTFAAGANSVALTGTNTITSGGILVQTAATSGTITGGIVRGSASGDLWVYMNAKPLTIGSEIANNGGATGLTVGGAATLTLNGTSSYTGVTTIGSGSTLQIGATGTLGSGNVSNFGTLNPKRDLAYAGIISGTGGLTVNTTGTTTTLTGANTYTGTTAVSLGALTVSGGGSLGNTTLNLSGGTLNLLKAGALTGGTLAITGGTLNATVPNAISGSASLSTNNIAVELKYANDFTGTTSILGGSLTLSDSLAMQNSALTANSLWGPPNGGPLRFTAGINTFTIGGLGTMAPPDAPGQRAVQIVLTDLAGSAVNLKIGANNTPYLCADGGQPATLPILSGLGGITKVGTGIQVFGYGGGPTYLGGTNIENGTLQPNTGLPATTVVTFGSTTTGGTLDAQGTLTVAGLAVATGATGANQVIGNGTTTGRTITVNGVNPVGITSTSVTPYTFSGRIVNVIPGGTSTLALTLAGGSQTLSGANTYTGTTTITGGTLTLDMGAGGSLAATSPLTLSGGKFVLSGTTGQNQTLGAFTITGTSGSKIAMLGSGAVNFNLPAGWNNRNAGASLLIDYSGFDSAGTPYVHTPSAVTGTGWAKLNNSIMPALLVKDKAGVTGFGTQDASFNIGRYDDVTLGTTLDATSNDTGANHFNYTTLGTVYTAGTLTWTNSGALTTRTVNSLIIDTTTNGGTIDMGLATNVLTLSGNAILFKGDKPATLKGGQLGVAASEVIVHQASSEPNGILTIASLIGGTTGSLTVDGAGVVVIPAATTNVYQGITTINGGTLRISANAALGLITTGATVNLGGGTLEGNTTNGSFTLDNAGAKRRGIVLNGGSGSGGSLSAIGNNIFTVSGVISGAITPINGGSLTKTGPGTVSLTGLNTYPGLTYVNAGTLSIISNNSLGVYVPPPQTVPTPIPSPVILNGGTLEADTSNGGFILETGANKRPIGITSTGGSLAVKGGDVFTVDGTIIGSGPLTKTGPDTLLLSGANTYTGGTTVSSGTLTAVSATALGVGVNSSVAVSSGATLNYMAPSNAQLAIGGALTLADNSTIGGSIGSTTTNAAIAVSGVATNPATGNVKVNVFGIPGVTVLPFTNDYTIVSGGGGNLNSGATYSLGAVYNASNFTVGDPSATTIPGSITVPITQQPAWPNEYWKGGLGGNENVWAASNGKASGGLSNWTSDLAGASATSLTPGSTTTVNFSITDTINPPTNQGSMALGANMSVAGVVINDTNPITLNAMGYAYGLTLGTNGISVASGAGPVTLNPNITTGGIQTWSNNSTNLLTIGGPVNKATYALTASGTGTTLISGNISGSGGITKTGAGTLILAGTNSFTGGITVNTNGGTVIATNPTFEGYSGVTVNAGGAFNYMPSTDGGGLYFTALTLTGVNGTPNNPATFGGAVGATTTSASLSSGNANAVTGPITVNVSGIPGVNVTNAGTGTNTYNLFKVNNTGGSMNGTPTLGTVYNAISFTVGALEISNTPSLGTIKGINAAITYQAPLTALTWKGGFAGNFWAVSNGLAGASGKSNWATDSIGTDTPLTPGPAATVTFPIGAGNDTNSMELGAPMWIGGLVVAETHAITLSNTGFGLTLGSATVSNAINVNSGAGGTGAATAVTLNPPITLGAVQTWINDSINSLDSTKPMLVVAGNVNTAGYTLTAAGSGITEITGNIGGTGGLTMMGSGTLKLSGAKTYSGLTAVASGTLKLNAPTSTNNIAKSPTIQVDTTLDVTGLKNGTLVLAAGQTLKCFNNGAAGTVNGGLTVASGSYLSPGVGPGTFNVTGGATTTWAGGGHYVWEVNQVDSNIQSQNGYKGQTLGHDWLSITGALNISATSGSKFNLDLNGLDWSNAPGGVNSWDNTKRYDWTIASASSGITNFDATKFSINASNFTNNNSLNGGTFSVLQSSNDILLRFTPAVISNNSTLTLAGAPVFGTGNRIMQGQPGTVTGITIGNGGTNAGNYTGGVINNNGLVNITPATTAASGTVAGGVSGQAIAGLVVNTTNTGGVLTDYSVTNTSNPSDTPSPMTIAGSVVANRTLTATSVDLGTLHISETSTAKPTTISSATGNDDHWTRVTLGAGPFSASVLGGTVTLAAGSSYTYGGANDGDNFTARDVTGSFTSGGAKSGTATFTPSAEGLTGEAVNSFTVAYTANVFSGTGMWTSTGTGDWATNGNWTDLSAVHAAPGMFGGSYDGFDTASFDGTGTVTTISLNGASPSLKSIQFSNATGYTVEKGTGSGTIIMKATTGKASITASGSASHVISAPISAVSDLDLTQTDTASLTLGSIDNAANMTVTTSSTVAAGAISGIGSTQVNGSLTADSIVQNTLSIGSGGVVTIRETTGGSVSTVPEPGTWVLIATALLGLLAFRRRR